MMMARNIAGIAVLGSLGLLGCGDPVPPAAQAGISIHIEQYDPMDPDYGMLDCPPYRHWINVPYDRDREPGNQKQLTNANEAVRAVNNQDGNVVSCTVKPEGSKFSVTGKGNAYAEANGKKYKPSIVNIRIPSIGEGDTVAPGVLSIQDDASLTLYSSDNCRYSVQGDSRAIEAGKIWGSLRCEALSDPKTPDSGCLVDAGYFVFENCAQ